MNINFFKISAFFFIAFLIIPSFSRPAAIVEEDAYTSFAKGQTAFFNRQYKRAIPFFAKAIQLGDTSYLPFYFRGLCYLYSNSFDSAILDLEKAKIKNNKFPDIYNNLGLAYFYLGEFKLALDNFNSAISLDSDFAEAYSNRASVNIEMGEVESALFDLEKGIKLKPKNPLNYYERGRAYYKMKKYNLAIDNFTRAIKSGLKVPKVYYNRGNSYFKLENYRKAIADYSKCLELDTLDIDALNNRAIAFDKIGEKEKANKDRRRLKRLTGNEDLFIPFEEIQFVQYTDSAKHCTISIPSTWNVIENYSNEFFEIIISPEKISTVANYSVGIRFVFNPDMERLYKVKSPNEILDFWRGSVEKNSTEFEFYQFIRQKIFSRGGYTGTFYETIVQFKKNTPYYRFYEVGLSKENTLLFGYFQAPEIQFEYFRKIFDKILETLVILR